MGGNLRKIILLSILVLTLSGCKSGSETEEDVSQNQILETEEDKVEQNIQVEQFNVNEIAKHNNVDDCWLLIEGRVYDVTSYIIDHPAPPRTIIDYCGGEATKAYDTKETDKPHSEYAHELLEEYFVGEVKLE